VPSGWCTEKKK